MKKIFTSLFLLFMMHESEAQAHYNNYPVYNGHLGLNYSAARSTFSLWSPPATAAQLILYKEGENGTPYRAIDMKKGDHGTWHSDLEGDWKGTFYVYRVKVDDKWMDEVTDPYARAVGINGKRAMIVDLRDTDPKGWHNDKSPAFSKHNNPTDALIYELHVRDATIDKNSGVKNKGKFSGLAEKGTKDNGMSTGLDHLKELGVTHIHLLPFYDYSSVDETKPAHSYNWGYDPLNYNVPEGSYSTNAYDGTTRIRELKEMIKTFHENGLRVIFDAVYNHTALTGKSNFNQLVPGYYYRHKKDGSFSDATACGNETASEMPMMRKFILESVLYWVKEYHIDGFRFDLMGVHDIETMNLISKELHAIKPDIILYGEGWTAGESPLPESQRALKKNASMLDRIAVFSDDIRDGIKGSVFTASDRGFASDKPGMEESIKFGIVAACQHPQVNYGMVNYDKSPYANAPHDVITYCECHDNNTLWDKLAISAADAPVEDRKKMHQLALTIILTSQGIPFLHAGTEFLRSKNGVENSYNTGDSINAIQWNLKEHNADVLAYIKQLVKMRKQHPAFRMTTQEEIAKNIHFLNSPQGTVAYTIDGTAMHDTWSKIFVAFNGSSHDKEIQLPPGHWTKVSGAYHHTGDILKIEKFSAVILKEGGR